MTHPYTRTFVVRWGDVDANGHMRNTAYSELASDTRAGLLASLGYDWARFQSLKLGPILFREEIEYRREANMGDEVIVDALSAGLSPDAYRWSLRNRMWKRDGTELAVVTVVGAWIDLETRKLVVPPADLAAGMRAVPRSEPWAELPPQRKR